MKNLIVISTLALSLSSCQAWIEFDFWRLKWGFIITLVIGVIGIVLSGIGKK